MCVELSVLLQHERVQRSYAEEGASSEDVESMWGWGERVEPPQPHRAATHFRETVCPVGHSRECDWISVCVVCPTGQHKVSVL